MGQDRISKRIYKVLDVPQMKIDTMARCSDLVKLLHGAHNTVSLYFNIFFLAVSAHYKKT